MASFPVLGHEYSLLLAGAAYGFGPGFGATVGFFAQYVFGVGQLDQIRDRIGPPIGACLFWTYGWFWIVGALINLD